MQVSEKDHSDENYLNEFLFRSGLLKPGATAAWHPLAGGVSSDIWRVELPDKIICVKRALANLRVKADWQAPVERNNFEWKWFKFVDEKFPGIVPRPLAHDDEMKMLAIEFLPPENFTVWKKQLLDGNAEAGFAALVGQYLGKIHAASAGDVLIAEAFATDDLFFALRIEPYLLATAAKHPGYAERIEDIAKKTLAAKIALVHGDVSPKNILTGPHGPVFLDAETAWYGDPAFDAAFCLNHFLLKSAFRPAKLNEYMRCFSAFAKSYLKAADWEETKELERRIACCLFYFWPVSTENRQLSTSSMKKLAI